MWTVWDKKTKINGFSAEYVLSRNPHLSGEDTIFIKTIGNRVCEIQGKCILADAYGVDASLPDDEFIVAFEAARASAAERAKASNAEEEATEA